MATQNTISSRSYTIPITPAIATIYITIYFTTSTTTIATEASRISQTSCETSLVIVRLHNDTTG